MGVQGTYLRTRSHPLASIPVPVVLRSLHLPSDVKTPLSPESGRRPAAFAEKRKSINPMSTYSGLNGDRYGRLLEEDSGSELAQGTVPRTSERHPPLLAGIRDGRDTLLSTHVAPHPWPKRLLVSNAILFVWSTIFFSAAVIISGRPRSVGGRDLLCETSFYCTFSAPGMRAATVLLDPVAHTPTAAIAIDELTPEWGNRKFATNPLGSKESIFRQQPSDDVEATWARVADLGVLVMKGSDVGRLGKNTLTVVRAPASWAWGRMPTLASWTALNCSIVSTRCARVTPPQL
jgi:hypothetical protein